MSIIHIQGHIPGSPPVEMWETDGRVNIKQGDKTVTLTFTSEQAVTHVMMLAEIWRRNGFHKKEEQ